MKELMKDKYVLLLLCGMLLFAYIRTSDSTIATLLTGCVGGLLGLVRATPQTAPQISNSENVSITATPNEPTK